MFADVDVLTLHMEVICGCLLLISRPSTAELGQASIELNPALT